MVTCPNPSCGKVFSKPLKTLNLRGSAEPYMACPFCLTIIIDSQPEANRPSTEDEKPLGREKSSRTKEKPSGCLHHVGFLSEREDKQQIPDECIVCKDLLECMLQKMRA